ncbi:MAG: FAD-dependent oxidoreductase, partial [Terriglobia bacterium]
MRIAIVGGGLSGLATAYQIQELAAARSVEVSVTIYEKENRLGGTIKTDVIDGYWCETGPPGFLSNKPETIEL